MDYPYSISEKIIFADPSPQNQIKFVLQKPMFIIDGYNVPRTGRCDNLTYNAVSPVFGTEYQDEGLDLGVYSPYLDMTLSLNDIRAVEFVLDASPLFCFIAVRLATPSIDGTSIHSPEIQEGEYPGALWGALSIAELFKNIREWALMVESPFNSNHPMAIYSKLALDTLNPPESIINEIDSMPDMHLARFLKGDVNHRDYVDGFPQMSEDMIVWFKEKLKQYPYKTTEQYIHEIIL